MTRGQRPQVLKKQDTREHTPRDQPGRLVVRYGSLVSRLVANMARGFQRLSFKTSLRTRLLEQPGCGWNWPPAPSSVITNSGWKLRPNHANITSTIEKTQRYIIIQKMHNSQTQEPHEPFPPMVFGQGALSHRCQELSLELEVLSSSFTPKRWLVLHRAVNPTS